jgi:hypothetical protein
MTYNKSIVLKPRSTLKFAQLRGFVSLRQNQCLVAFDIIYGKIHLQTCNQKVLLNYVTLLSFHF